MFWTAGWGAILTFSSGVAGIAGMTVTAVMTQRSTTRREVMLADRSWNQQLLISQRDVITDFLLYMEEFKFGLVGNIASLWVHVAQRYAAEVVPSVEKLVAERGEDIALPESMFDERIEPTPLPESFEETARGLRIEFERRLTNVELMIADDELTSALDRLAKVWEKHHQCWSDLYNVVFDWKRKKSNGLPKDFAKSVETIKQLLESIDAFKSAAFSYFHHRMGA